MCAYQERKRDAQMVRGKKVFPSDGRGGDFPPTDAVDCLVSVDHLESRGASAYNDQRSAVLRPGLGGRLQRQPLVGRFTNSSFTLTRYARAQTYFLRSYDGSGPPKYSRYSASLHVDYPL